MKNNFIIFSKLESSELNPSVYITRYAEYVAKYNTYVWHDLDINCDFEKGFKFAKTVADKHKLSFHQNVF